MFSFNTSVIATQKEFQNAFSMERKITANYYFRQDPKFFFGEVQYAIQYSNTVSKNKCQLCVPRALNIGYQ